MPGGFLDGDPGTMVGENHGDGLFGVVCAWGGLAVPLVETQIELDTTVVFVLRDGMVWS